MKLSRKRQLCVYPEVGGGGEWKGEGAQRETDEEA